MINQFRCIGNIANLPHYQAWSQQQALPTNVNTALMLPEVRATRIKIRTQTANSLAQRHGYTDTDVLGADPMDYLKYRITDYAVVNRVSALLGLEDAVGRVQIQRPGEMVLPHCDDLAKSYIGSLADDEHYHSVQITPHNRQRFEQNPRSAARVLIMLEDWRMGQGFGTEDRFISHWSRGDVFAWDWPTVVHSTFNSGYWPRPLLRITGMTTARWDQWFVSEEAFFNLEY